jgi:hypothetical protein
MRRQKVRGVKTRNSVARSKIREFLNQVIRMRRRGMEEADGAAEVFSKKWR